MTRAIIYASAGDPAAVLEATEIPDARTRTIQVEVRAFPIQTSSAPTRLDQISAAAQHVAAPGKSAP
ncbi:hypothetical protein [Rhodococcus wratislaviensis]|uniref:Oxidoreductase n=1 Tax=Rhodococcus wratislaviensis NBRC 100605 TaxID=1219028 RepID=X0Q4M9_RHOWR|nr:hypothetical protein [Rhodococcus wratislaviensis]GAF45446.1 hypothetical protein RW1_022_00220 [Rhodococcus wratislaviensis NBRC 100605]